MPFDVFHGNCPKSVNRDAKYRIHTTSEGPAVELVYLTADGERWIATTTNHPDLISMVNEIKNANSGKPHGPFYINEYSQVIVPAGVDGEYFVASEPYDLPLRFVFEGQELSGDAVDLQGNSLHPGDIWSGPHPGIPYILTAGKNDVYYRRALRTNVTKDERLSAHVGPQEARTIAERIRQIKGWSGGRFYVNEWKEMFAPVTENATLQYRYIGHLEDEDPWFPKPE